MKAHGIFRLGRDAEHRQLNNGTPVVNMALATNVRKGQEELTVWVDAAFFGTRAEALLPYLLKGTQIAVDLDNLHQETYNGQNGPVTKLTGRVVDITLLGKRGDSGQGEQGQQRQQPQQQPQQQRQAPPPQPQQRQAPPPPQPTQAASSGFDDMDDDIPF